MTLNWLEIQNKWQRVWQKTELGKATVKKNKEKFFMIFAYPGISGFLHVGHLRGFSYTDAICRYQRLLGKEVLFPVGTHASGNQAIAFAKKVEKNDPDWIEYLKNNGCSEEKIITLKNANNIVEYFNNIYVDDYWKKFGFLCDWDRFTCTTFPDYEKFIQWQFKKLQQKDLLIQKPYFATACIQCGPVAVDPSETDISKGGNAEKQEFTLLKFKFGDDHLIAATLRPETIFGQTNLWINPDASYIKLEVEGENWIVSKECAEKLQFQKEEIILKEDIDPKKYIGQTAIAPGILREIIILPASFCDPKIGTGIVTSVPSDAPYDYLGLKNIQNDPELCRKYALDINEIKAISLIPIITSKGYGEFPAKEIVEQEKITDLNDPKLQQVTKEIYKAGYHTGTMAQSSGKYTGMRVEQAKELIKAELIQENKANILHDLTEEVTCRCGNKVVIKKIDDQWFIRYSDTELTERSKEQAKEMHIFPQEYYENMPSTLEWFSDRACARLGNWLGSKFPFDERWIIEPISDSTLYPAYYIISKFIHNKAITTEELTEEFFDYVLLNKGQGKEPWTEIREEFDYFYPLDINLGGKEHKTVHFPVFLMNHVAILPEEKWPRGIFVNWWVTGKGTKISKSKGGAEPIPAAIEKYGVDAMRLYYAHIGSPHVDVVWTEEIVLNYKNTLERIYVITNSLKQLDGKAKPIDHWLNSRIQHHLKKIDHAMKEYDLRELASHTYFSFYEDLRWYQRRGGEHKKIIKEAITVWCTLMNPLTPHLSEEINALYGNKELMSTSAWPKRDEKKMNLIAEAGEELIRETIEGMRNVVKLAKIEKPQKFHLFIAEDWLYSLFTILHKELKVTHDLGELMKRVLAEQKLTIRGKEVSKIVMSIHKDTSKLPSLITSQEKELHTILEAREFLQIELGCSIEVLKAEDSQNTKAKAAMPGKVGILVE